MSVLQFGLTPKVKPLSPKRSALVAALDVGTSKVACLIARLKPQGPQHVLRRRTHAVEVVGFVEQPSRGLDLPLDIRGTAFQQRVWEALRKIPAGSTASYAEIARRLGMPTGARAVATACAANALAVAIPCHRVVSTDGSLSGYRWGVERKAQLIEKEAERRR